MINQTYWIGIFGICFVFEVVRYLLSSLIDPSESWLKVVVFGLAAAGTGYFFRALIAWARAAAPKNKRGRE